MADSWQGFDAIAVIPVETLRETLRRTMVLGLPVEDSEKPTFYFLREVDWQRADSEDTPWDLNASPISSNIPPPVQIICAYEFFSPLGRQGGFSTVVGDFNPTTLIVTMFEDEFNQVMGFSYATVGPGEEKWWFRFWRPAYGLGDMTIYQVHLSAEEAP